MSVAAEARRIVKAQGRMMLSQLLANFLYDKLPDARQAVKDAGSAKQWAASVGFNVEQDGTTTFVSAKTRDNSVPSTSVAGAAPVHAEQVAETVDGAAGSRWSADEEKKFSAALLMYAPDTYNRWALIASAVGGNKTKEACKKHANLSLEKLSFRAASPSMSSWATSAVLEPSGLGDGKQDAPPAEDLEEGELEGRVSPGEILDTTSAMVSATSQVPSSQMPLPSLPAPVKSVAPRMPPPPPPARTAANPLGKTSDELETHALRKATNLCQQMWPNKVNSTVMGTHMMGLSLGVQEVIKSAGGLKARSSHHRTLPPCPLALAQTTDHTAYVYLSSRG